MNRRVAKQGFVDCPPPFAGLASGQGCYGNAQKPFLARKVTANGILKGNHKYLQAIVENFLR